MDTYYGVLLETVSIQNYIFQSNKLKQNLGASHLIQNVIFDGLLKETVKKIFGKEVCDCDAWENNPAEIMIFKQPFEVGYVGGGNALLLFEEKLKANQFIKSWTRNLLIKTPGVTTAVSLDPFNLEPKEFHNSLVKLFKIQQKNKVSYIPQTTLPRHGITAECPHSGFSAEIFNHNEGKHVSAVVHSKIEASKLGREHFNDRFQKVLKDEFCFTDQFEKLGSISGEDSHIAIVHIDGNRMADRFRKAKTLEDIRRLSFTVQKATTDAFEDLLDVIVKEYKEIMAGLGFDPHRKISKHWYPMDKGYNRKILPLTPIVIGGDDVTFVCDGKLGIYFSELFIKSFENKQVSDHKKLSACAGIAVTKVAYPFYRGYQMAEELCNSAKKLNDGKHEPADLISGLDFQISMGGIFGSLDDIRKKHFQSPQIPQGDLLYRPYKLVPAKTKDKNSLELLLQKTAELRKNFPNNKIKELRENLTLSKQVGMRFVKEMKCRGKRLPDLPSRNYAEALFENSKTPYYDMIELNEFYPQFAMGKGGR